jgi:vacuolar-type H+-ATPase subunit I/STV1
LEINQNEAEDGTFTSWVIVGIVFGFLTITFGICASWFAFRWRQAVSKGNISELLIFKTEIFSLYSTVNCA